MFCCQSVSVVGMVVKHADIQRVMELGGGIMFWTLVQTGDGLDC